MKKYELSKIGTFHINHNEDAVAITEIGQNKLMMAVMDGCSMGEESHFASTLIAKVLRKIGKEISFKEFIKKEEKSVKELLKETLGLLFGELKEIKNRLLLEREEMLSTLILGILNHERREAEIIAIGDGLICDNGRYIEYEQDNQPDYLGYHLSEDFEHWFQLQQQKLSLKNIEDLSLSTDGIFTFKKFDNKHYRSIEENELLDLMLIDRQWSSQENMLKKKLVKIEQEFGLKPSDDLSILRIII